jgi:ADP-ribose pyrophosphatase YjhB (NUDIX family)
MTGFLPQEKLKEIYSLVPRICVDAVIRNAVGEVLLTCRNIEPFKGSWHLPGGRIRKGETLPEALNRIILKEIGCEVAFKRVIGYTEDTAEPRNEQVEHSISIIVEAQIVSGSINKSNETFDIGFFSKAPASLIPYHLKVWDQILKG